MSDSDLQAWVIERMGKFHRILDPGLNFLIPIVDKIKYVNSLKEIAIDIPKQSAITKGRLVSRMIEVMLSSELMIFLQTM